MFSNVDVTAMFLRHPDSRIFHIHIQSGASPYTPATPINSQKSTKSAVSHPASPYAVAMPHRSPCGPYSHTVSLTRRSPRPARTVLADLHSNPTHSNSLRRRGGHGYGVVSRRGDGVAVGPCVQAGLKAGACGPDPRGTLGLRTPGLWHA